jgi:hypothetical protein
MTDEIMTKMGFAPEGSNYRHTASGGLVRWSRTRKRPWTATGADGVHMKDDAGLVKGFMTPHACATAALKHWGIR